MNYKEYKFILDLKEDTFIQLNAKQAETGVKLIPTLTNDGTIYDVTGTTVRVVFSKPDKNIVYTDCTIEDSKNGLVSVVLSEQVLAKAGYVHGEIRISGKAGLVKSFTFVIKVHSSVGVDEVKSWSEVDIIDKTLYDAIRNANSATSVALNKANEVEERTQKKTREMEDRVEERISNMESRSEGKILDIEKRWSNLTTAKQNDADVIDARVSTAKKKTFKNINERFEEMEEDIHEASYSPELENTSSIFSLGTGKDKSGNSIDLWNSVTKGQVSDVGVKGKTIINFLGKGFKDSNRYSAMQGTIMDNGFIKLVADGSCKNAHFPLSKNPLEPNKEYNVLIEIRKNTLDGVFFLFGSHASECFPVSRRIEKGITGAVVFKEKTKSNLENITNTLRMYVPDYVTSGEIEFRVSIYDIGLSEEDIYYLDGTKSTVGSMRLKAVGKNLFEFPTKWHEGKFINGRVNNNAPAKIIECGGNFIEFNGVSYCGVTSPTYYKISPGFLKISAKQSKGVFAGTRVAMYDSNFNLIEDLGHKTKTQVYDIPATCYVRISFEKQGNDVCRIEDIQVEQSSMPTPHEPYTESIQYIQLPEGQELRSLPNGVCDEVADGKLIKRVSDDVTIDGSENWFPDGRDPIQELTLPFRLQMSRSSVEVSWRTASSTLSKFPHNRTWANDIECHAIDENRHLIIRIAKSKLITQDVAGFKAWLQASPITLTYQLAEPEIIPIEVEGELQSYPGGTIYVDPYIAKIYSYNNGIVLDYPVSNIDKLQGFNEQGQWVELENEYQLSPDGLTLTIDGVENGDKVKVYAPIRPEESTIPTISYKAPTNTKATINDTLSMASKNRANLDKHDSMLLGLALNFIDLDVRLNALEK